MIISVEMKSIHDVIMLETIVEMWKAKWKADEIEEEEDDEEDDDTVSDCDTDDSEDDEEEAVRRIFRACGFVWPDRDDRSDDHRRKSRR